MPRTLVLLVGAVIGAASWGVAFAVDPVDTIAVCHRPGVDLRAPSTNGSCPSGYTKTEISDGADGIDGEDGAPGAPATNPAYFNAASDVGFSGLGQGVLVTSLAVPAGSYAVIAEGDFTAGTGTAVEQCAVRIVVGSNDSLVGVTELAQNQALDQRVAGTLMAATPLSAPGAIEIRCTLQQASDVSAASTSWRLMAVQVSSVGFQ